MRTSLALKRAAIEKRDEFYTRMEDVERELSRYPEAFKGRIVFCNSDDPLHSAFVRWFAGHFRELGLRRLMSSCKATASRPALAGGCLQRA